MKSMKSHWLFIPCLVPLVAYYVLPSSQFKNIQSSLSPQFRPNVNSVTFARDVRGTNDKDARSYTVKIFFNHKGLRPSWWGDDEGTMKLNDHPGEKFISSAGLGMSKLINPRFIDSKGKTYSWESYNLTYNLFDSQSQQYFMLCDIGVSKEFQIEGTRFLSTIKTKYGLLKVDTDVSISPP